MGVLQSFVIPRGRIRGAALLDRAVDHVYWAVGRSLGSYERRDRILASQTAAYLMLLLWGWLISYLLGFALLLRLGPDRTIRPGRTPLAAHPPPPPPRRTRFLPLPLPNPGPPVTLGELVRVAGRRWTIEESFRPGTRAPLRWAAVEAGFRVSKGLAGLDEHQLRRWLPWRRWTLLAMLAHALLAVIAGHRTRRASITARLIALTCNEIQHLFTKLITEPPTGSPIRMPGHAGDADISTKHAPATTEGNKLSSHNHDLRLEYQ